MNYIVIPKVDESLLSSLLVKLTEKIEKIDPKKLSHGLLGGEYGYGADYDNDVFMMYPYCWCEQDDCKWCDGTNPNFRHKKSGLEVGWYKYIGRGMEARNVPKDLIGVFQECFDSLKK